MAAVLCAYLFVGSNSPDQANAALGRYFHVLWQALSALGLVFVLLFLADLLLKREWIQRNLGRESGARGWAVAPLNGFLLDRLLRRGSDGKTEHTHAETSTRPESRRED
ncbi:MAG: hypothetical protein R6X15_01565 [Pseudomonadota bacterium]